MVFSLLAAKKAKTFENPEGVIQTHTNTMHATSGGAGSLRNFSIPSGLWE